MSNNASGVGRKKRAAKNAVKKVAGKKGPPMVSPTGRRDVDDGMKSASTKSPRRVLFGEDSDATVDAVLESRKVGTATQDLHGSPASTTADKKRKVHLVTPSTSSTTTTEDDSTDTVNQVAPSAKRRLLFGRYVKLVHCAPNVDSVYKIVRKLTGSIGGNGYSGPIYGELTKHSMQKMIDLMIKHTDFSSASRFIDVGSGIGKPNLHVAQYPGVEFSCGVEMEHSRWSLGLTCLKACLNAAVEEREQTTTTTTSADKSSLLQGNTMFLHNNILEAKTFDPFTHVYMFSIGFPPDLWIELSKMWNRSDAGSCQYLICYAGPKNIIDCYEFDVELLAQIPTSMHGSKEGHMGYIYGRTKTTKKSKGKQSYSTNRNVPCDPLFKPAYKLVKSGLESLEREVDRQVEEEMGGSQRTTRSRQKTIFSKCY